jgi:sugar phosphate isomerase/epimerase
MHERISASALCFLGQPLPEIAAAWRELQPRRVSFLSMMLGDDLPAAKAIADAGGYRVETITHPFLLGGRLEADEATWEAPRAALARAIDDAQALGAQSIYMTTGGLGSLRWEQAAECFSAAIAPCLPRAEAAGVALMVECAPPMRIDSHIATSLHDTILLAEMAGIGVCIDVSSCWTEAGLKASIERAMPRCRLIQIGDYVYGDCCTPGRAVPGDGVIPLRRILGWALDAGYRDGFDLELIGPRIDAEGRLAATRRAAEHLGEVLRELGA